MSSSMEEMQTAVEATVYDLIRSGLGGQMLAGDSFGLWTFNKEVYTGKFTVMVWDPKRSTQQGARAASFLSGNVYEKRSDLKKVMGTLSRIVGVVSNLTVFIISDGNSAISGTPFDKAINADYRKKNRERSQAKVPYVTTLVVRDGGYVSKSVTIAGQPIFLPQRPPPAVAAKTPIPPTPTPGTAVASNVDVKASAIASTSRTQDAGNSPQPKVAAESADPASSQGVNGSVSSAASNDLAASKAETAAPPVAPSPTPRKRVMQILTKTNTPPPPPVQSEQVQAATAAVPTESLTESNTAPVAVAPAEPSVTTSASTNPQAVAVSEPASSSPPTESTLKPSASLEFSPPIPVAARELNVERQAALSTPGVNFQPASGPPPQGVSAGVLLTFGGILMGFALFLTLVVFRRARPAPNGSFITQSFQRR
jgi:hypothetical protein